MRDDSVKRYLSTIKDGTVFSIQDILVKGSSYDSLKTQLSKACSAGQIKRIVRGIYYKPKFSPLLNDYVRYKVQDLVSAIARMNRWRILPSGNMCLNLLGLSTQVPSQHIYYSNGPNHKYDVDGICIEFRHRSPRDFPDSDDAAIVIQAVKARGKEYCDDEFVAALSRYIHKNCICGLLEDSHGAVSWVRKVISDACAWGTPAKII